MRRRRVRDGSHHYARRRTRQVPQPQPEYPKRWLERYGDPYQASAYDVKGAVGIDYGVYGVPETYVIDKRGVIRYKQIGPVTPEVLERKILPLLTQLERDA